MVGSDNKAEEANRQYGSHHTYVAERLFFIGVISYDMGDNAKSGENKNIHFGVTKESEEVLIEDGVPSAGGVKKGGVEVAVC